MQLVFPTNFGSEQFYTIVNLKDVQIESVEVIDKKKNPFPYSKANCFIVTNTPENKEFSVNDLNVSFHKDPTKINNSIDNFLSNK